MPYPALSAFIAAAIVALVSVVYLWRVQRARFVVAEGVRALAAMRWREFSQFVITALQAQGFDAHPLSNTGNSSEPADLVLTRADRSWLLSCQQSVAYRVTPRHVEEMRQAVQSRSAAGGIIATLGQVDAAARRDPQGVELLDGGELWALIGPLLPPGLHEHLQDRAQMRTRAATAGALGGATVLGAVLALALVGTQPASTIAPGADLEPATTARVAPATDSGVAPSVPADAATAAPAATSGPVASAEPAPSRATASAAAPGAGTGDDPALPEGLPADERQQRERLIDALAAVPGIDRAVWSSRSTLVLYVAEGSATPREPICKVMQRFDALRASRIQLQPPAGSVDQVRFFHCAMY